MHTSAPQQKPYAFPANFTPEKRAELFQEIVLMYDVTENILAAIQREPNPFREKELEIATPFITQATNSANIISAFYTEVVGKNRPFTAEIKETIETAFRNYYIAQREIVERMYSTFMPKEKL